MMPTKLDEAARDFLSQNRIAVAGVSRQSDQPANLIYRKLRDSGHQVFAVNPRASELEGGPCYPGLRAIPGGVEALVIATPPEAAPALVEDCAELGVHRVWMHRSFGPGSVSDEALALCEAKGIQVIPGACPMMFCAPVDVGHRCIRWFLRVTGKLPAAAALCVAILIAALPLASCQPATPEVSPQEIERAQARLQPFKDRMKEALIAALGEGPENAIAVCREHAPEIAESLSVDGIEMGRTSHRLRNPANAAPVWVEPLLEAHLRLTEEEAPLAVYLDDGRVGYVEPIRAIAMCMSCHGPAVEPDLLAEIHGLYPDDRATGFRTGDLRGLFWITLPAGG